MGNQQIRTLARAAIIAAIYASLTLLLAPISYGPVQFRLSEGLTILPVLMPEAIPGLFVGCLLANILGGSTILDIVFGSLATLVASLLTRKLRARPVLAALPPVLVNALVIGLVLSLTLENMPFGYTALTVGAGQVVSCYGLGLPLWWSLRNVKFVNS